MKKDLHFNFEGYICNNPENVQHKIFSIPEKYSFSCSVFLAKIILFYFTSCVSLLRKLPELHKIISNKLYAYL